MEPIRRERVPVEPVAEAEPEPEPEPVEVAAPEPEPEPELPGIGDPGEPEVVEADILESLPEPEPEPQPEPLEVKSVAPEPAAPVGADAARLPSFLHRARPAEPERPKAQVVEAPDPVADDEVEAAPGVLGLLAGVRSLTPEQAAAAAPLAEALRGVLARAGAAAP